MTTRLVPTTNNFEIKVLEKYRSIVPPMAKDEYEDLKESIRKEGQHVPIIVRPDGVILDRHHRHQICQELGIPTKYEIDKKYDGSDELLEQLFVIDINLFRRHLTPYQRVELALKKKPLLAKQADENQKSGKPLVNIDKSSSPIHVRKELAKEAHVSEGTFYKAEQIIESDVLSEDIKDKARTGDTSINYAYQMLQRAEDRDKPKPKPPQGQYDVLLIDPPWKYQWNPRGSSENHYPVMEDEEIKALQLPAADDAILFMWATNPKLDVAFEALKTWGFTYKTNIVWIKDKIGNGYYVRGEHELLLIAVKGKGIGIPAESDRPESAIVSEKRTEHSKKPDVFYEIIEQMYPARTRIEMFARGKPPPGWTAWGNEVVVEEEKAPLSGG